MSTETRFLIEQAVKHYVDDEERAAKLMKLIKDDRSLTFDSGYKQGFENAKGCMEVALRKLKWDDEEE